MQKVVGIKIGALAKIYFFDPKDIELKAGDVVVVSTDVGTTLGVVAVEARTLDEKDLDSPIKPIARKATKKDIETDNENKKKVESALKLIKENVKNLNLAMKIVGAEYTLDSSKIIIDFTAEERVDFRELLKILAVALKTRIELRQIGQRDEVKIKGGIGPCGEICCCSRFLNDFEHVTVKMAKNQGLSLSPTKISGLCGRLMCCLGYENSTYEEILSRLPKLNSIVETKSGKGTVVYLDILRERVSVKIPQGDDSFVVEDWDASEVKRVEDKNKQNNHNNKQSK